MEKLKKVEIIINRLKISKVIDILEKSNITGYTYHTHFRGYGERGFQDGEGLSNAFSNAYFIIACSEEKVQFLKENIQPLIKKVGGVCLVSDVEWLIH